MQIVLPSARRYAAIGRCIYCGTTDPGNLDRLSDEHIVPFGLGGDLILPRSSCSSCALQTSRDERFCLRDMLLEFRTKRNFPTRKPKNRSKIYRIGVFDKQEGDKWPNMDDANFEWKSVTEFQHPTTLMLPRFAPPGVLWGKPLTGNFCLRGMMNYADQSQVPPTVPEGRSWISMQKFIPDVFCRMLAKIAHGAAVAEIGMENFIPNLPELILGKSPFLSHFVGCPLTRSRIKNKNRNVIKIFFRQGFIVASVHLFADFGMLPYDVVVGRPTISSIPLFSSWTKI